MVSWPATDLERRTALPHIQGAWPKYFGFIDVHMADSR